MLLLLFLRVIFLPLYLFSLHLASLFAPLFWSRAVVFSMARAPWWSCGALSGSLAALCSRSRGALLRRLSQCRCECELVNPCESLASRVPCSTPSPLEA